VSTVTVISSKWRCYIARKKFLNLKEAANTIAANYKRLRVQRYVKRYRHAAAITRKFIIVCVCVCVCVCECVCV